LDYFPCREMHTFDAVLPCGPGSWSAYPPLVPWVPRRVTSRAFPASTAHLQAIVEVTSPPDIVTTLASLMREVRGVDAGRLEMVSAGQKTSRTATGQ
jgi:hypothetical protein